MLYIGEILNTPPQFYDRKEIKLDNVLGKKLVRCMFHYS